MPDHPFWSDGFDMDLPKVLPEARGILGELGDVLLRTTGGVTHGRLNHPSVWNGHDGRMLAFFGFRSPAQPLGFVTSSPEVTCTAWEAFRDAWPHAYRLNVENRPVWDTDALRPAFETILWDVRGWQHSSRGPAEVDSARAAALASLRAAVERFRALCDDYRPLVERAGAETR